MNRDFKLDNFMPHRLDTLARSVTRSLAQAFEQEFAVSLPEWRVIVTVGHFPGLAAVDIAERTLLDKVAVSRAVHKLLDRGILARRSASADRRRSVLELTVKGERLREGLESRALRIEAELLQDLPTPQVEVLLELLERLDRRSGTRDSANSQ